VYAGSLSDVDDNIDVRVVVVVRPSGYFDVLVGHSDVVGVDFEILGLSMAIKESNVVSVILRSKRDRNRAGAGEYSQWP
jgi:hypothetical protein